MEPSTNRPFPPVEAGAVLAGVTSIGIGSGALLGYLAGSTPYGIVGGAAAGLPAGIATVYLRYRGYFS